jgi:hypothetical protein
MFNPARLTAPWPACCSSLRRSTLVVVVLLFLLSGGAQVLADQSGDDVQVLAELNDDDYRVRQTATQRLLLDEALTQDALAKLFVAAETPEQRHRLLAVSKHHAIREMIHERFKGKAGPGSMGLSHQVVKVTALGEAPRTGVLVVQTLAGFPAYAVLEPGDVIVSLAGEPLPEKLSAPQFPPLIRQYQAHDTIDLTILRDDKPVSLRFEMEFGEALQDAYDPNGVRVKPPYSEKWLSAREKLLALLPQASAPPPAPAEEIAGAPDDGAPVRE